MSFVQHGRHLIDGEWGGSAHSFQSDPAHGPSHNFSVGTGAWVDQAAEAAFWSFGWSSRATRATFLRAIADQIEARADAITLIGSQETGLLEARLNGERAHHRTAALVRCPHRGGRLSGPPPRRRIARPQAIAPPGHSSGAASDRACGGIWRVELSFGLFHRWWRHRGNPCYGLPAPWWSRAIRPIQAPARLWPRRSMPPRPPATCIRGF
jgi:hypothetical protein